MDSLVLSISDLIYKQHWLLVIKLDVVDFMEVFLHVGFTKRFLVRFFGLMGKREVNIVEVSTDEKTINLIGSTVMVSDDCNSPFRNI